MEKNKIHLDEVAKILKMSANVSLFGGLSKEQMGVIMDHSEIMKVDKGTTSSGEGIPPRK